MGKLTSKVIARVFLLGANLACVASNNVPDRCKLATIWYEEAVQIHSVKSYKNQVLMLVQMWQELLGTKLFLDVNLAIILFSGKNFVQFLSQKSCQSGTFQVPEFPINIWRLPTFPINGYPPLIFLHKNWKFFYDHNGDIGVSHAMFMWWWCLLLYRSLLLVD